MALFGGTEGIGASLSPIVDSLLKIFGWVGGLIIFGVVMFVVFKVVNNKKKYNIPVTIWIPRSDNTIVDEVQGRGGYFQSKAVGGITSFRLKRKGVAVVELPPPSSKFLVGLNKKLYLVQKGVNDYEPVIPKSFLSATTPTGKKLAIVDLLCVNQDATAWYIDNEETAKRRFTLVGMWDKYKDIIQFGIIIFVIFVGFYIQSKGLETFTAELGRLVSVLKAPAGSVVVS